MIWNVFWNDIKSLLRSFFAVVIVIGLCFIPALYAWFNIYSNIDPYGNTGNIKVAVVSLDKGAAKDDGTYLVAGDMIVEKLKDNDAINWQFAETKESAIKAVKSGKYYAALIIPADFTENMFSIFSDGVNRPTLLFYQNQKKNAIASKITDTVVGNLQESLNEAFISVVTEKVFEEANELSDDLDDQEKLNEIVGKLEQLKDSLHSFNVLVEELEAGNVILKKALTASKADMNAMAKQANSAAGDIAKDKESLKNSREVLATYQALMTQTADNAYASLEHLRSTLVEAKVSGDIENMKQAARDGAVDIKNMDTLVDALKDAIVTDVTGIDAAAIREKIESIKRSSGKINTRLNELQSIEIKIDKPEETRQEAIAKIDETLAELDAAEQQLQSLRPLTTQSMDAAATVLDDSAKSMNNLSDAMKGIGRIFDALLGTAGKMDDSLEATSKAMAGLEKRLDEVITKVNAAKDNEKWEVLIETLSGSPTDLAQFFSSPVEIVTEAVYPVKNYGSAVTPFYTILAIWVGGVVLAALVGTSVDKSLFPGARDYELFLGRFVFFALINQIQAAIIVVGNLKIFHVQCLDPLRFWFASAYAGFVFTLLIYALVASFGDVGKAAVVVMLVLQVAGSSGTFPIELLPEFFRNVYIFFPFPYAINALRECVGGMYGSDYWMYLMQLSAFIPVALVIGIWARRAFADILEFMEMRMEDTEMM